MTGFGGLGVDVGRLGSFKGAVLTGAGSGSAFGQILQHVHLAQQRRKGLCCSGAASGRGATSIFLLL